MAIGKGITCDPVSGIIYGVHKKEITNIMSIGYSQIQLYDNGNRYMIYGHHFIWYWVNKEVVKLIDHINGKRDDNRIENLRSITHQENLLNKHNTKGYTKAGNKYTSKITINGRIIYLGIFNTKEQARQVYLDAKKIYHTIERPV